MVQSGSQVKIPSPTATPEQVAEISAISRLAFARKQHPELVRAEARARLTLAMAIMKMDELEDVPGRHNLAEQLAVNSAQEKYGQALADLIRGEAGSSIGQ